ncbi:hypothetical protein [Litoribacter populi]|uniref:hypothetical protein n=1 Tax=Litoribacter populi TaxID=2598460 RepID=UPI00117D269C|nr:hypothetical protein [Litoribacter populi]
MSKPYHQPKIQVPKFCEENGFYTTKKRSYNMSRIKGSGTKPEKNVMSLEEAREIMIRQTPEGQEYTV